MDGWKEGWWAYHWLVVKCFTRTLVEGLEWCSMSAGGVVCHRSNEAMKMNTSVRR